MSDPQIVEVRRIPVQDGQELEVSMTQAFIDRLRQHFGLFGDQQLDDEQVKLYVWGAVNTAVTKAEHEVTQDVKAVTEVPDREPARASSRDVRRPRRRKARKGS
jgi:hypothetical protein